MCDVTVQQSSIGRMIACPQHYAHYTYIRLSLTEHIAMDVKPRYPVLSFFWFVQLASSERIERACLIGSSACWDHHHESRRHQDDCRLDAFPTTHITANCHCLTRKRPISQAMITNRPCRAHTCYRMLQPHSINHQFLGTSGSFGKFFAELFACLSARLSAEVEITVNCPQLSRARRSIRMLRLRYF